MDSLKKKDSSLMTHDPSLFKRIHRIEIHTKRLVNDLFAGAYRSAFRGNGMEFEEVREYHPGDEVRTIDWNVTARMNHPYVKIYREERELTLILLVDISASLRFGTENRLKKEIIAEIAAVLAFSAIKNNDKVGLILFSEKIEKYLPPRKGVRHVLRVIRELLAFQPQERGTSLLKALDFLGKVQKRSAICFILSDFLTQEEDTNKLRVLARRNELIAIHVTDPRETFFPDLGLIRVADLETEQVKLIDSSDKSFRDSYSQQAKRRVAAVQEKMGKIGAGYLALETNSSYEKAMRNYFRQRERMR